MRKLYSGAGALASAEGNAKDWWGVGRAMFAAGLRKGSIVINCFAYDLNPQGHMIESGAAAIGCPVIPAGTASLDDKIAAIQRLHPSFFCGTANHLKEILDLASDRGADVSSLENALVTGLLTAGLRSEFALRGIVVRSAFIRPELGLVAYESEAGSGLCVSEGLILELVAPGTDTPVAPGIEGEIVVSRINADYPLLRYGTGALASELTASAPCGRTNMRISTPRELAPESAICAGTRIHVTQLVEIARQHPDAGRMRLVIGRLREQDALRLKVEHGGDAAIVGERLSETLHQVTRVRGTVELVAPGSLSDDDAMIIDERPLN